MLESSATLHFTSLNTHRMPLESNSPNIEDVYPLSPLQEGLLFHTLKDPGSGVYVEQLSVTPAGKINLDAFEKAWNRVTARHPALRTSFHWEGVARPVQVVRRDFPVSIRRHDWRDAPDSERTSRFESFLEELRVAGFDLAEAPPMRLDAVRLSETEWRFVWTHHHILLDGWSVPIVLGDVLRAYRAESRGVPTRWTEAGKFRDYVAWLEARDAAASEAFWRTRLAGFTEPVELPESRLEPLSESDGENPKFTVELSESVTRALVERARAEAVTLNTVLQGAWARLLGIRANRSDIVFGVTVSGRPAELRGIENTVGLFINTIPARIEIEPEAKLTDWLRRIQERQADASRFEDAPLARIQSWSDAPPGTPLFQTLFVFENYPTKRPETEAGDDLRGGAWRIDTYEKTHYPLTMMAVPGNRLSFTLLRRTDSVSRRTAEKLLDEFKRLVESLADGFGGRVADWKPRTDDGTFRLVLGWNDTAREFSEIDLVHRMFERSAAARPNRPAVEFKGRALTYAELNREADRLAARLSELGIGVGDRVGILCERSMELIVAVLGVLKSGAAYVPIDPSYPQERIDFILDDSRAEVLVTDIDLEVLGSGFRVQGSGNTDWNGEGFGELNVSVVGTSFASETPNPEPRTPNPAYVIYTSGSTGKPKGVVLGHAALSNLLCWQGESKELSEPARTLQFASICFDVSFQEIFSTFLTGGTLVLIDEETRRDPEKLLRFLESERIERAFLPVIVLQALAEVRNSSDSSLVTCHLSLKNVVTAGEQLRVTPAIREYFKNLPDCRLHNHYGPSETHVVTAHTLDGDPDAWPSLPPIGRPIANVVTLVLDSVLEPCPVGVQGEIFIGGVCLASGYLNRPELTSERFISNPFFTAKDAKDAKVGTVRGSGRVSSENSSLITHHSSRRLYRTGDLGRWTENGEIEFLGRIDDQVKIRGFRVEPEEVASAMRTCLGVETAFVMPRPNPAGALSLTGYYTVGAGTLFNEETLWNRLRECLPDYMIPSVLIRLEAFPITPNGKIDRRKLPDPGRVRATESDAPVSEIETLLGELWAGVLNRESVRFDETFFEAGGHSLTATRLVSRINEVFDANLSLKEFFAAATIAKLSQVISDRKRPGGELGERLPDMVRVEGDGPFPLSFSQERLWFLDQLEPDDALSAAVRIRVKVDPALFERVLREIVRRHEILRTTFDEIDGRPVQIIHPDMPVKVMSVDLSNVPKGERKKRFRKALAGTERKPFDLKTGPLFRFALAQATEETAVVVLELHHIVSDDWSLRIMFREIAALYRAMSEGKTPDLPVPPARYVDYAVWQRRVLDEKRLENLARHWKSRLENAPRQLNLPVDRPRGATEINRAGELAFTLPSDLTESIRSLGRRRGLTVFMVLFAGFNLLLSRYAATKDPVVGVPVSGRRRREIENVLGFFVNTLVLHTSLDGNPTFAEFLDRVREVVLDGLVHQDFPFEKLVEILRPERDSRTVPVIQAMFDYQFRRGRESDSKSVRQDGLGIGFEFEKQTAGLDLTLFAEESETELTVRWMYNRNLFHSESVERMARSFEFLLRQGVGNPGLGIDSLESVHPDDLANLVRPPTKAAPGWSADSRVHSVFERQAEATPDRVAVVFTSRTERVEVSYRELNRRADEIASALRDRGVGPGCFVGLPVERSVEFPVGVLGILKAGAAYVPIDPSYPQDRIDFILEDSRVEALVTDIDLEARGSGFGVHGSGNACRDFEGFGKLNVSVIRTSSDSETPNPEPRTLNPVYVIYTSGSTGKPKGVVVEHASACNLAFAQIEAFGMDDRSRVMQFSSPSFDASVSELLTTFFAGGTLFIADRDTVPPGPELVQYLRDNAITTVTLPPALLAVLSADDLPDLQTVVSAGEACSPEAVRRWAPGRRFVNAYGPTEATVCATAAVIERPEDAANIGKPIAGVEVYVLDENGRFSPVGVGGEIHVGGAGLAWGYLNRPDLTAEKFVRRDFPWASGARLYKTGDLGKLRPDGSVEFLGRNDRQVKLRGYRIELGEIESVVKSCADVSDAAVVLHSRDGADPTPVGFVVFGLAEGKGDSNRTARLSQFLAARLPAFMIPAAWVEIERMPLTSNGKTDFRALAAMIETERVARAPFVAPRTQVEGTIAEMWRDLLHVERIGVYDDFFESGGHSLLLTRLAARIREAFDIEMPLRVLFDAPTINDMTVAVAVRLAERETEADVAQLLDELSALSPEEAAALLALEETDAN